MIFDRNSRSRNRLQRREFRLEFFPFCLWSEMSDEDEDYRPTDNLDENENSVKRIKAVTIPSFKTGISMGMRRTFSPYTPKSQTPQLHRSILRPTNSGPMLAIPFKPPKMLKPTHFAGGGLRPGTTLGVRRTTQVPIHSMHNPNDDDAFVVYRPKISLSEDERLAWVGANPGKKPEFEVEVVIVIDIKIRILFWPKFLDLIKKKGCNFFMIALQAKKTQVHLDVSWLTRWDWEKLCSV